MKIRRIRSLKVNSFDFKVTWDHTHNGGSFSWGDMTINIGVKDPTEEGLLMIITHELMEIVACEMNVRFRRPDCDSDYIFVYDHRQHETMANMFAGLLSQFIK